MLTSIILLFSNIILLIWSWSTLSQLLDLSYVPSIEYSDINPGLLFEVLESMNYSMMKVLWTGQPLLGILVLAAHFPKVKWLAKEFGKWLYVHWNRLTGAKTFRSARRATKSKMNFEGKWV
jgi:hypothetical protein